MEVCDDNKLTPLKKVNLASSFCAFTPSDLFDWNEWNWHVSTKDN